jgi:protein-tyrosine phosphatase
MYRVLFVCTGNICRSPSAEGIFHHLVEGAGLDHAIMADSVGLHGYHVGEAPDARAVAAARRRGVDLSGLRARRMTQGDYTGFELILAMDRGHYRQLAAAAPADRRSNIRMFMSVLPDAAVEDVPDPYYGGAADFEYALDLIETGARGWLKEIQAWIS